LNRSGEKAARTEQEAQAFCSDAPDAPRVVDDAGAPPAGGESSTVIEICGVDPVVHRWGALPRERVEPVLAGGRAP
jgi:tRNA A37 threonylcarbamoyladenosine synthetase subunit TsaC/SUA5/YrdC